MIFDILSKLSAVSGRNDKIAILKANKDNDNLREFFRLALDPLVTFGIKKIPQYIVKAEGPYGDIAWAFESLKNLQNRTFTGNAGIDYLAGILESLTAEDAKVIERVIAKDPACGVAGATVNTVWENTVFEFPIMKATPHDEKTIKNITFPAYSQLKLDGARCAIVIENGVVSVLSSSGREIETHGQFDWFNDIADNAVFDGELLVTEVSGQFMERKKGNGIVNKAVKGTISVELAKQLHFVSFDIVPLYDWKQGVCTHPYETRSNSLVAMSQSYQSNASIVETRVVHSESEAIIHFKELYNQGQEGTILKTATSIWENKRSKHQLKFKGILTCDLQVVAVEEGTGKNTGKVGALVCRSSDGELEVNVGTGLSDADRAEKFEFWVGKIVEVQYNERILSKVEGSKYSLFLPRFVQVRIDKMEADGIDNISIKGE